MDENPDQKRPIILLVEDDPLYLQTIEGCLEDDFDLVSMNNGTDAIQYLKSNHVDLLITDIVLPRQTGNEVIQTAVELPNKPRIIAMSGGGRTANMTFLSIAKGQGVDHVVQKPFDMNEFADTVAGCFS